MASCIEKARRRGRNFRPQPEAYWSTVTVVVLRVGRWGVVLPLATSCHGIHRVASSCEAQNRTTDKPRARPERRMAARMLVSPCVIEDFDASPLTLVSRRCPTLRVAISVCFCASRLRAGGCSLVARGSWLVAGRDRSRVFGDLRAPPRHDDTTPRRHADSMTRRARPSPPRPCQ